jgi:hypothetical protein
MAVALVLSALTTYAVNPPLMMVAVSSEMRQANFRTASVFAEMCSPARTKRKKSASCRYMLRPWRSALDFVNG